MGLGTYLDMSCRRTASKHSDSVECAVKSCATLLLAVKLCSEAVCHGPGACVECSKDPCRRGHVKGGEGWGTDIRYGSRQRLAIVVIVHRFD